MLFLKHFLEKQNLPKLAQKQIWNLHSFIYSWPLSNSGLNCIGPLIQRFYFNKYTGNIFGDLWQFNKSSQIFKKYKKNLGMSWMYKIYVDSSLLIYYHNAYKKLLQEVYQSKVLCLTKVTYTNIHHTRYHLQSRET